MSLRIGSTAPDFHANTTVGKIRFHDRKLNTKVIGLSVDPVENHVKWAKDIEETQGTAPNYPLIGDTDLNVSKLSDMLPE